MNIFDFIFIALLVSALIKGLFKGFVMELATLAALFLGIIGAVFFSGIVTGWLSGVWTSKFIPIISFLILFVGIIIAVHLLSRLIDKLLKAIALGWLNRIAGGFLSFFKMVFLISILILTIDFLGFGERIISSEKREKSLMFSRIERFAPSIFEVLKIDYEHLTSKKKEKNKPQIAKQDISS